MKLSTSKNLIFCVSLLSLPATAQLMNDVSAAQVRAASEATPAATPATSTNVTTTGGVNGYLPMFTGASTVTNSIVYQTPNGIGIGDTPNAMLDVHGKSIFRGGQVLSRSGDATTSAGAPSYGLVVQSSVYNTSTKSNLLPYYQLQSEPTGNNTATTGATYNFLYFSGQGSNPVETGLYFNPNGTIHFAPEQTFPITTGAQGPQGPQGPEGPAGPTGPQGVAGPASPQIWTSTTLLQPFTTNVDQYGAVMGVSNANSGSDYYGQSKVSLIFPHSCTASNFSFDLGYESLTFPFVLDAALAVNGTDTALSCSTGFATGYGFSCTSSASTAIPAGSFVSLHFSHTGTNPSNVFPQVTFSCQ